MTKLDIMGKLLCIAALCAVLFACASTPEPDRRPELMQSAEKSLELGVSNYLENNFDKAEAHFSRALFLYRTIDNPQGITSSCINIAKTKLSSGQVEGARAYAEAAQSIMQRENLTVYSDHLALIQSSIALEEENTSTAKQLIDALLVKTRDSSDNAMHTAVLQNRTRLAFMANANDTADWISQYRETLKKPGQNTSLNQARLLRFEAALVPDNAEEKLRSALSLYREAAHAPGIAATLGEWAAHDASGNAHQHAIEKLQRALFIRTNLHDRKNSQKVLQQLSSSYNQLGNRNMADRSNYWSQQLNEPAFKQWEAILAEFENYPG